MPLGGGFVGEEGEGDGGVVAAAEGGGVEGAAFEADAGTGLGVAPRGQVLFFGGRGRAVVHEVAEGCYFLLDELLL